MRILPVAKKEMRQLSRDPRTLAVLVAMPGFILLFYGYVLNFDVHHVKLAVLDQDRSAESRALVHAMTSGDYFDVARRIDDPSTIRPILDEGKAAIVLAIPPDFSRKLARGGPAPLQAIVDGSNATLAQVSKAYAEGYVSSVGAR
ncbi:MAG TPA: ABC transporter permease, partial [Vulgatibacter sp.]